MNSKVQARPLEDDIGTTRFTVQSSDVLADMRVNITEEGSERVIWYKASISIIYDEIVEHFVENGTSTLLWTIHRPKRGWYIRLRTPSFPPDVFIPLLPLPQTSPYYLDSALTFACRNPPPFSLTISSVLNFEQSQETAEKDADKTQDITTHDVPKLGGYDFKPPPGRTATSSPPAKSPITHFVLSPQSRVTPQQAERSSLFTRMFSALKTNAPAHSYTFALSPIPDPWAPSTPSAQGQYRDAAPSTPIPLLTFFDQTPVWTVNSVSGVIEIDMKLVRSLGVETSFYIAVALTYLDFVSDRESYLAALND
ncbi:uncharacterized protein B0H18DRAFT_1122727 [Fomitopsis serialis]|uniref:uncharacterized protein n=1 Tax=Fomitopsis serialis TaxID=139415 RepID=UPI0020085B51|nr:uncharacterized protein B0H18DRAFT_1122727 [Neoantrodia serialis]KAH9919030.1 hypothetical protein B0H18DRAFT_1122727 [Neoantrodia serialis]